VPKNKKQKTNVDGNLNPAIVKTGLTPRQHLERLCGPDFVPVFNFALSPADHEMTRGFPGGAMPKSVNLNIRAVRTISKPSNLAAGSWNLAILTLPSPSTPALHIAYQGDADWLNGFGTSNSGSCGPLVNGNMPITEATMPPVMPYLNAASIGMITYPNFPLTTLRGDGLGYSATSVGRTAFDLSALPEAPTGAWGNGAVVNHVGLYANMNQICNSFRICGQSVTTELVCNALTNQGMVYSRCLNRILPRTVLNLNANLPADTDAITAVNVTGMAMVNSYLLDGLPVNSAELVASSDTYVGQACNGTYTPIRFIDGGKDYYSADLDAGVLSMSTYDTSTNTRMRARAVQWPLQPRLNQGQGAASLITSGASVVTNIDENWAPSLTIYEGIDANASVNVKVIMGVECTPNNGGALSGVASAQSQNTLAFRQLLEETMRTMKPAGPASENWEWEDVGRWLSRAWSIAEKVLPILIMLV